MKPQTDMDDLTAEKAEMEEGFDRRESRESRDID